MVFSDPTLGPYSFYKDKLWPKSTNNVITQIGLCFQIPTLGPYSFYKEIAKIKKYK